ncbi:hypothetical protein N2152v2_000662 [Parachlorella kessleri]
MSSLTTTDAPILRLNGGATELAIVADRLGHLLILGTQAGEVKCFDAARAKLRWTAAGAVDGAVADVSCSPDDGGLILVVGRTGGAAVLNPATGAVTNKFQASKNQLSRAALLPGGLALVCGSGVQLFDACQGERLHKFTGHANPVAAVAATPDGRYLCTAAEGERTMAVWNASQSKSGKRKHKSAAAQLALDQAAVQLEIAPSTSSSTGGSGSSFCVAAVTQGGAVWLFECSPAASGGTLESRLWGRSAPGSGKVLAVGLEAADESGASLVVVTGTTAKPAFQTLRVDKEPGDGKVAQFTVESAAAGALLGRQEHAGGLAAGPAGGGKARAPGVTVVDPAAGAVLATKVAGGLKRGADQDLSDEEDAAPMDAQMGEEEDATQDGVPPADGPTFAERLAALQLQDGGGPGDPGKAQQSKQGGPGVVPKGPLKADSLSVLLSQALQSGDRALLERCFTVRNEDVVRKTAARLSSADAALFLKAAVQRLQSAPARGEQLAAWIRAVLLAHAGSLVATAGMQGTLAHLYQIIEARLASYHSLLSLAGRLDVVLAHAQRASGGAADAAAAAGGAIDGPLVVIEVGSDGGIEVEDAFAATGNGGLESGSEDEEGFSEDEGGDSDEEGADGLDEDGDDDNDGASDED